MPNEIVKNSPRSQIEFIFDMKGSRINRQVLPKFQHLRRQEIHNLAKKHTLKDEDFTFITKFQRTNLVNISVSDKRLIMQTLRRDTLFL